MLSIAFLSNIGTTIFIMHSLKICGLLSVLMVIGMLEEGAANHTHGKYTVYYNIRKSLRVNTFPISPQISFLLAYFIL